MPTGGLASGCQCAEWPCWVRTVQAPCPHEKRGPLPAWVVLQAGLIGVLARFGLRGPEIHFQPRRSGPGQGVTKSRKPEFQCFAAVSKTTQKIKAVRFFFPLQGLGAPYRGTVRRKDVFRPSRARNGPKTRENYRFWVSGTVSGETPPN